MTARTFRPTLEALEDRRTPSGFFFTAALGGGHSAVSLLIDVQTPPNSAAPETVAVIRELPNGVLREHPPTPISGAPADSIHELIPPGPYRGWLEAADVSSSVFVVPVTVVGGGTT